MKVQSVKRQSIGVDSFHIGQKLDTSVMKARTGAAVVVTAMLALVLPLTAWIATRPAPLPALETPLRAPTAPLADDSPNNTPTHLLNKFGYPSEVHEVVTEDGYILRLDRIPNPGRPVVYIAHGLQTSAAAFILLGPKKAIALILHDAGYDVWLANFRGSTYSEKHRSLKKADNEFWNFSWNEHGVYDNPANIDYILQVTGQTDLSYVGHSMGSTSLLVTASERLEYQKKIRGAYLMAPASFFKNTRSLIFKAITVPIKLYEIIFRTRVTSSWTWYYRSLGKLGSTICPYMKAFCSFVFSFIVGKRPQAYYWEQIPDMFDYIPAGGSTGEIFHYVQLAASKIPEFRMYDHGPDKNREKYGHRIPPQYNLTNIQVPIYLYSGPSDILCDPRDIAVLKLRLGNLQKEHVAADPYFNHIDPMTGQNAAEQIFAPLLQDMREHDQRHWTKQSSQ